MTELADKLARMTLRVTSPDRRIRGVQHGRGAVRISFATPNAYQDYRSHTQLADQIALVLNSTASATAKTTRMLLEQHTRLSLADESHWDGRVRRFRQAETELTVEGSSPQGTVRVTTTGLSTWSVHVIPGAIDHLSAGAFCAAVNAAILDAHGLYAARLYDLRAKEFGQVGPPRKPAG